jgi:hypothetical protein
MEATSNAGGDCARASSERARLAIPLITANRFRFEDVTDRLGRVYCRSAIWLRECRCDHVRRLIIDHPPLVATCLRTLRKPTSRENAQTVE